MTGCNEFFTDNLSFVLASSPDTSDSLLSFEGDFAGMFTFFEDTAHDKRMSLPFELQTYELMAPIAAQPPVPPPPPPPMGPPTLLPLLQVSAIPALQPHVQMTTQATRTRKSRCDHHRFLARIAEDADGHTHTCTVCKELFRDHIRGTQSWRKHAKSRRHKNAEWALAELPN